MANPIKFAYTTDFSHYEALNFRWQNLTSNPSSPSKGWSYFNSSTNKFMGWDGSSWIDLGATGAGGSLTDVAVATANGFAGTSDHDGTTPTLTLTTTITGLLKGNGTAISAATSGTDYAPATSGTSILKGNGSGGFSNAVSATDYAPATSGSSILKGNGSGGFSNATSGTDYAPATATTSALKGNGSGGFSAATLNDVGNATAAYSLNSQRITNLADPSSAQDAATKNYVDLLVQGIKWKAPVRAVATANGTLASAYENGDTLDGLTLATGDRILLAGQTSAAENGIYTVNASGAPTRATDADANGEISDGVFVPVQAGTAGADSIYYCTATGATPWVAGTSTSTWARFTNLTDLVAGAGLTKTGQTIDVIGGTTPTTGGNGGGLVVNANDVVIDTAVVVRKYSANFGDGASTSFAITHSLGTKDVQVTLRDTSTDDIFYAAINCNSTSQVTVDMGTIVLASNGARITVFA